MKIQVIWNYEREKGNWLKEWKSLRWQKRSSYPSEVKKNVDLIASEAFEKRDEKTNERAKRMSG